MPVTPLSRSDRLRSLFRDRLVVAASAAVVALAAVQVVNPDEAAAATDGGRPQVIVPMTPSVPTSGEPLDEGGSATGFSLKLADGAACTGDSAADAYRVQSYIVPASVDPATLKFDANGPTPQSTGATHRQPLFDIETTPYVNAQTAQKDDDFKFGRIIAIPAFALGNGVWTATELPPGDYNVGLACTKGLPTDADQLDKFFNTVIEIEADAEDPGGFTFSVPENGAPTGGGTTSSTSSSSSSTSTTAAGGATTTTAAGGTTTTTGAGGTTTTVAGGGAPTTSTGLGTGVGRLPTTGSSTLEMVIWGLLLFTFGRIFFLMRRGVRATQVPSVDWD